MQIDQDFFEALRAEYLKDPVRLAAPFELRRLDGYGHRYYWRYCEDTDSVKFYPSVTSIINATMPTPDPLIEFYAEHGMKRAKQIAHEAACYGTFLHAQCGIFAIKQEYNLDAIADITSAWVFKNSLKFDTSDWVERVTRDLLAFAQFCKDYRVEVLAVEHVLCSDKLNMAGAIDFVLVMDDKKYYTTPVEKRTRITAIVDVKSPRKGSNYDEYAIQLNAYKRLWNEHFAGLGFEVTKVMNWNPKEWTSEPTYTITDHTESSVKDRIDLLLPIAAQVIPAKPKPKFHAAGVMKLGESVYNNFGINDITQHILKHFRNNG